MDPRPRTPRDRVGHSTRRRQSTDSPGQSRPQARSACSAKTAKQATPQRQVHPRRPPPQEKPRPAQPHPRQPRRQRTLTPLPPSPRKPKADDGRASHYPRQARSKRTPNAARDCKSSETDDRYPGRPWSAPRHASRPPKPEREKGEAGRALPPPRLNRSTWAASARERGGLAPAGRPNRQGWLIGSAPGFVTPGQA